MIDKRETLGNICWAPFSPLMSKGLKGKRFDEQAISRKSEKRTKHQGGKGVDT